MNKLFFHPVFSAPVFLLMLALTGCNKEADPMGLHRKGDSVVSFVIGGDAAQTKSVTNGPAGIVCGSVDLSEEIGIANSTLTEELSSLDDVWYNVPADTKGTPVYTENLAQLPDYKLTVVPYATSSGVFAPYGDAVVESVIYDDAERANVWTHDFGSLEWPVENNGKVTFFISSPEGLPGCIDTETTPILYNADGTIEFDFESPVSSDDDADNDAIAQKDILFSSKVLTAATKDSDNRVLLYHALTAVKFKIVTSGTDKLRIQSVDKVGFTNLYSQGHCKITPNYVVGTNTGAANVSNQSGTASTKSSAVSLWTALDGKTSFTQVFDADEQGVDITDGSYDYPGSIAGPGGKAAEGNLNDKLTAEKTFMFVPQDLTDDVELVISYTCVDGTGAAAITSKATATIKFGTLMKAAEAAKSVDDKVDHDTWKAGELRTYTITVGDRVDVDITDEVNKVTAHTKSDLKITNTGTAAAYMRVAVVGNWFYVPTGEDDQTVVAALPCNVTSHLGAVRTEYWIKGNDGYFYYKYPVAGGKTIAASRTLFGSVTFTAEYDAKPYDQCDLKITIPVQAVRASQVATAWGAVLDLNGENVVAQLLKDTMD